MSHRTRRGRRSRRAPLSEGFSLPLLRQSFLGAFLGGAVGAALLLPGAALCLALPRPHGAILPVSLGILCLAAAVAGFWVRRRHRASFLLCGVAGGGVLLLLLALLSLAMPGEGRFSLPLSLGLRIPPLVASCLGAYLAGGRRR